MNFDLADVAEFFTRLGATLPMTGDTQIDDVVRDLAVAESGDEPHWKGIVSPLDLDDQG